MSKEEVDAAIEKARRSIAWTLFNLQQEIGPRWALDMRAEWLDFDMPGLPYLDIRFLSDVHIDVAERESLDQ